MTPDQIDLMHIRYEFETVLGSAQGAYDKRSSGQYIGHTASAAHESGVLSYHLKKMREDTLVTPPRSERMDATCITRRFPWREVVYYVVAQMMGALLGTLTLRLLIGDIAALGINLPSGSARRSLGWKCCSPRFSCS
jgi:hypothetical protein